MSPRKGGSRVSSDEGVTYYVILSGRYRIRTCDLLGVKPDWWTPFFTVFGAE